MKKSGTISSNSNNGTGGEFDTRDNKKTKTTFVISFICAPIINNSIKNPANSVLFIHVLRSIVPIKVSSCMK